MRQRFGVRWQRCEGKALASATPLWGVLAEVGPVWHLAPDFRTASESGVALTLPTALQNAGATRLAFYGEDYLPGFRVCPQHPTSNDRTPLRCSSLDVGCWMLGVLPHHTTASTFHAIFGQTTPGHGSGKFED